MFKVFFFGDFPHLLFMYLFTFVCLFFCFEQPCWNTFYKVFHRICSCGNKYYFDSNSTMILTRQTCGHLIAEANAER